MNEAVVIGLMREALTTALLVGAPILATTLVIGVVVSLIQAVTQVNEATLTFVPKLIGVFVAWTDPAPWRRALVALCLDLSLRREGHTTLDAVMRALWARCLAGPMREDDLLAVLADLGGRDFSPELADWVHGTGELPLKDLLEHHGVAVHEDAAQPAQRLGLRVTETAGIQVKVVLRGGAAERAGFSPGDEWLAVETDTRTGEAWRLHKLDDLALYAGPGRELTALVARDKRLLRLPLTLPERATTWRLSVRDATAAARWLTSVS